MMVAALQDLFLCADAGGTKVKVAIGTGSQVLAVGQGGPCNLQTVGHRQAIKAILQATIDAMGQIDGDKDVKNIFKAVWIGIAGLNQQRDHDLFMPFVKEVFGSSTKIILSNDANLLASPCLRYQDVNAAVTLIAGTGTMGMSFLQGPNRELERVGISGGWGYLLDDQGSGYAIGRLAMRWLLENEDLVNSARIYTTARKPAKGPLLRQELLAYFEVDSAADLINDMYAPGNGQLDFTEMECQRKVKVAGATRIVFRHAFAKDPSDSVLPALSIVQEAVEPLVDQTEKLVGDQTVIVPAQTILSLGGALFNSVQGYRELLVLGLAKRGITFGRMELVEHPAIEGLIALGQL